MNFTRLEIPDVILCEPQVFEDGRGHFAETFRQDKLDAFLGFKINFCQDNESKSSFGVLRGLHYQLAPYAQTKLVRVIRRNGIRRCCRYPQRVTNFWTACGYRASLAKIKNNSLCQEVLHMVF